ncbi:acylphosphatase [Aerococcus suis]|uniref:acylphosphatase n=1 Tax=Aerococcus suis TaxID=371602 RepID=A0A1W1YLK1_9LACT|nr:acylphosphatase [Aerococcus suis]MCI7240801.1 acylphosphatase [Aerococcus suis]MDD7758971.1 acylphosphatase [Aerococcus suis]MDY4646154.1 acylphosphatase [Aerococcus suis]SMC37019.1 acylphosphatase [Aerococcus suis]
METEKYLISGRVQGVGFRATAQSIAKQMGLSGSVANLSSGDVAIELQGNRQERDDFFKNLKNSQQNRALQIDTIESQGITDKEDYRRFLIKH